MRVKYINYYKAEVSFKTVYKYKKINFLFLNFLVGIPNVYHVTPLGEYTIMVLEFLDKNLDELMMQTINKKFSLKTVLMVADQIVK